MTTGSRSDDELTCSGDGFPDPTLLWPDHDLPTLGRYKLLYRLGHGSHGMVFTGYDTDRKRLVALKVFSDERPDQEIQREAVAMSRSRHDNVLALHDIDRSDGHGFLVMEFVHGSNMWDYMCRRRHGWRRTVLLFIQAARGLAAIHQAGFAHGDVKPENLLLGFNDHVYVADFSVARALDRKLAVVTDTRCGSRSYQPPERLQGAPADERADQYSLCVSLWQAIFLCRPWITNEAEIIGTHAPAKMRRRIGIPRQLEQVLLRGLAVDPDHRYESMTALADALTRVLTAGRRGAVRRRDTLMGGLGSVLTAALARVGQHFTHEPRMNMRGNDERSPAERRSKVRANLGLLIQRLRLDQGLTQERLAERSGLATDVIMWLEGGRSSPSLDTMGEVAIGLGMRLSEILERLEGE